MKVKDLSRDELKALIQDAVEKALVELLGDPDYGLELRKDVQERLQHSLKQQGEGPRISAEEVASGVKNPHSLLRDIRGPSGVDPHVEV